jgi:ribonuclease HI
MISYETTPSSPLVVNCDATVRLENQRLASIGLVVKNHNGCVYNVCGRNLGKQFDSTEAEVKAIEEALGRFAQEDTIQHITVRSDCEPAVLNTDWESRFENEYSNVCVEHIPRDQNTLADREADYHADSVIETAGGIGLEVSQDMPYTLTD